MTVKITNDKQLKTYQKMLGNNVLKPGRCSFCNLDKEIMIRLICGGGSTNDYVCLNKYCPSIEIIKEVVRYQKDKPCQTID